MPEPELIRDDDFLADSQNLYKTLAAEVVWDERIRARKTASFGEPYNYSGMVYETLPMHPLLVPLADRLELRLGFRPNNCLLNCYESGDSTMGFHSDSEEGIAPGTGVAIVSLGAERRITFRSKRDKTEEYSYLLKSGTLLYMPPHIQQEWKHAILKSEDAGGRISLTFRRILPAAPPQE